MSGWRVDLSVMRVQIDNGYDAWSIDNTRTTQSDNPSVDRQYSTGISARASYGGLGHAKLTAIATYADSGIDYGYDADWGNPRLWAPYVYSYTEFQMRHRSTRSLEVRLGDQRARGVSWLVGLYGFELREALIDTSAGNYVDPIQGYSSSTHTVLTSDYRSRNGAVYGQLDGDLGDAARWSVGLRGERRTAEYADLTTNLDAPATANAFAPADNLWGGHASVDYRLSQHTHSYVLISRGYKAGGFNLSQGLPANERLFGPEAALNYEIGLKIDGDGGRLRVDTSLFYLRRSAPQLKTGVQLVPTDPNTFVFYTGNAQSGYNYGAESTVAWRTTPRLELGGSAAWLQTLYRGFVQNGVLLPDRALAHAPDWQAAVNATWRDPRGPFVRVDVTGMGGFYYDLPPNPTRSRPYGLLNAKLGWDRGDLEVDLWGRNLLNKDYTVRGFYFGDEPPDFPNKLYTQLGDPRNWGLHLTIRF